MFDEADLPSYDVDILKQLLENGVKVVVSDIEVDLANIVNFFGGNPAFIEQNKDKHITSVIISNSYFDDVEYGLIIEALPSSSEEVPLSEVAINSRSFSVESTSDDVIMSGDHDVLLKNIEQYLVHENQAVKGFLKQNQQTADDGNVHTQIPPDA